MPEIREDVADYLGEVQAWDAGIGVMLEMLQEAGELDNTLFVVSGDHGIPGFPAGKCNLYDFGVGVSLLARGPGIRAGRVVDDFAMLMDLAPTFLDAGGVKQPAGMQGRSLLKVLQSDKSGLVDPGAPGSLPGGSGTSPPPGPATSLSFASPAHGRLSLHPQFPAGRAGRMGDPKGITDTTAPPAAALESNTFVTFADMDASPTRAWLVQHRNDPQWKWHYNFAFGKRPAEELYDVRKDPDQITNLAADPAFAVAKKDLAERLMKILTEAGDPRVIGDGQTFERSPFVDDVPEKKKKAK